MRRKDSREVMALLPLEMVEVRGGSFAMGTPPDEEGRDEDEGPVHRVTVSDCWIGATPVTQELYQLVCASNPGKPTGDRLPVNNVSWFEAIMFCNRLSEYGGLEPSYRLEGEEVTWKREADGYRLPTEAEWEHAARAGADGAYPEGSDWSELARYAWYDAGVIQPVARKEANAWGLYDVLGNVWEWCWDWHEPGWYARSPGEDPAGPEGGSERAIRGGCCADGPTLRLGRRGSAPPMRRDAQIGLRCVRWLRRC
jgi:formylglycine-generating enzyme required for sulfatase activity